MILTRHNIKHQTMLGTLRQGEQESNGVRVAIVQEVTLKTVPIKPTRN